MSGVIDALCRRYGVEDIRSLRRALIEAEDKQLGRPVLMRLFHDLPRWRRVAQVAALRRIRSIRHPNIVWLWNYALLPDGTVVHVLERLGGPTVADVIRPGQGIDRREAARIVLEAARGLGALHEAGVVHGDVSPSNLLLDRATVKLGDYEFATVVDHVPRAAEGLYSGTPAYTAPELASGCGFPTPQSDLYSLGCVYYELLTGRPPHVAGSVLEALYLHATADVPDARRWRPDLSDAEVELLGRLLARIPAQRVGSARELVDLLGAL